MAELKKYLDTTALGTLVDQIKAEDAKVLAAAKKHADDAVALCDVAGAAATAEQNAKAYTDALANGAVKANTDAIAKLNGTATTEGSVAKAIADAKALIDADVDAVEVIANQNKTDIAAINNAETGVLAQAKAHTDTEVAKVQGEVDALEAYVGTIPEDATATNVVAYVTERTSGIASEGAMTELAGRVDVVEGKVATIEGDYLKATDKTELEGKITNVQTAVDTEKSRAEGIEAGLAARIKTVEDDYLKAADKTELADSIAAVSDALELLTNGVDTETIDGVNDLIKYVNDHGTEVIAMQEDIAENASAIEGIAGRITTAEGKITTLEGAVANKVEQSVYDEKVAELAGADTALGNRIATLEGKFGGAEGSVEDMIADAQAAAEATAAADATSKANAAEAAAKGYTDAEIDKVEETVAALTETVNGKAAQSEVTTISGKVDTLVADMTQAKTDIDALEVLAAANKAAHEANAAAIALKASQADLEAAVERIAQNETDIDALETTVAGKADTSALEAAVARIAKNETDIATNTSAINSFTAITSDEVNAMFA